MTRTIHRALPHLNRKIYDINLGMKIIYFHKKVDTYFQLIRANPILDFAEKFLAYHLEVNMELKDAYQLAVSLINSTQNNYGLPQNLDFAFDRAKRRLGSYRPGQLRITLSAPISMLNNESVINEIIRHELAHALAHHHDNDLGHGNLWKKWARKMKAKPRASCQSADVITPPAPYVYVCPKCSFRAERYRRPARNRGQAGCPNCSNSDYFQPLKFIVNRRGS